MSGTAADLYVSEPFQQSNRRHDLQLQLGPRIQGDKKKKKKRIWKGKITELYGMEPWQLGARMGLFL